MTIIAILASLLASGLTRAKAEGQKAACLNNFRQLHLAWTFYSDDNNRFPYNHQTGDFHLDGEPDGPTPNWIGGVMDLKKDDWPDNTNTLKLTDVPGGIGTYLQTAGVFKCPADHSMAKFGGVLYPRVRSLGMSYWVGREIGSTGDSDDIGWVYTNWADVAAHAPRETGAVFIESTEETTWYGCFLVEWPYTGFWFNVPSARHNRAGTISFTDGHVISKKWRDARTGQPLSVISGFQPGSPDMRWLQDSATVVKPGALTVPNDLH